MIFRKIVVTAAIACLVLAFTACGDDDSSSFVSPEKETSSSIAESSSERSGGDPSSPSSSSSSAQSSSKNSSSSAKSSPSTDSKSSSSVKSSSSGTSSSSMLIPCSKEGEIAEMRDRETGVKGQYKCQDGFYILIVRSSSSSVPTSSYINMDSLYNSKYSYGEFVDPRDGQKYRILDTKFGYDGFENMTVFATNLNYGKQIPLNTTVFDDNAPEKYCYDDDPWYCDNGFGGLYSWSEAMGLPKACDSVWTGTTPACPDSIFPGWKYEEEWHDLMIQGACPEGWHVMNRTEWMALRGMDVTETGWALISVVSKGGNGTGFSAVFGGIAHATTLFENIHEYGFFHLAWEVFANGHRSVTMTDWLDQNSRHVNTDYNNYKKDGLSVRCVKDY